MNLHLTIGPVVSIIAGILILIMPRLLNYIVAIYLILIGLLELSGNGGLHLHYRAARADSCRRASHCGLNGIGPRNGAPALR